MEPDQLLILVFSWTIVIQYYQNVQIILEASSSSTMLQLDFWKALKKIDCITAGFYSVAAYWIKNYFWIVLGIQISLKESL